MKYKQICTISGNNIVVRKILFVGLHLDYYNIIVYVAKYILFSLVDAQKCSEKQPKCEETGGHCIQEQEGDENIKCICKSNIIPYTKESGCNGKTHCNAINYPFIYLATASMQNLYKFNIHMWKINTKCG